MRLVYRHMGNEQAENEAQRMARYLRLQIKQQGMRATELIGPVPCFYARLDGYYRWQILLRGPDPAKMLAGDASLKEWRVETNPQSLL